MKFFICFIVILLWTIQGYCLILPNGKSQPIDTTKNENNSPNKIQVKYGSKGWEFATDDGNYTKNVIVSRVLYGISGAGLVYGAVTTFFMDSDRGSSALRSEIRPLKASKSVNRSPPALRSRRQLVRSLSTDNVTPLVVADPVCTDM